MIPRSRRNLFSFMEGDNAGTEADRSHAGGVLHAKEGLGRGGGAHRERHSVGERHGDNFLNGCGCQCLPGRTCENLKAVSGAALTLVRLE